MTDEQWEAVVRGRARELHGEMVAREDHRWCREEMSHFIDMNAIGLLTDQNLIVFDGYGGPDGAWARWRLAGVGTAQAERGRRLRP